MATLLPPNRSPRPVLCSAYLSSCPTRSLISDSEGGGFLRPREGLAPSSGGASLEASMECSVCSRTAWREGRMRGLGTGPAEEEEFAREGVCRFVATLGANFKDGAVLTSNLCATICARSSALSTLTTL